jgi:GTPase
MASGSIFTYEPDPPRVSSPWLKADGEAVKAPSAPPQADEELHDCNGAILRPVRRLPSEPQEGPVEYKLHLLLRPRRKFRSTSTGSHAAGLKSSKAENYQSSDGASPTPTVLTSISTASTQQSRQHRLQQLTTQLLWRLQQSSPHHSSSATNFILPALPEALPELETPRQPARLLHGLEESQGALYEIGVADDGALLGLAEDEMQESLNNLRAMAACLGCTVDVIRREIVGECEWIDDGALGKKERKLRRTGQLVVVEALVKPHLQVNSPSIIPRDMPHAEGSTASPVMGVTSLRTEQVRVTLTGATMSGKSSLLGTLTTSTLDNGRGQSRLSMLKHRHEITSGITSSVTQELLAYKDSEAGDVEVINYATDNVASWIDVHVAAVDGRLLFLSDSAGHPRYRRTTVRSLVGWAPHWTLLCVPADDSEDMVDGRGMLGTSQHSNNSFSPNVDLSGAQLELCLRLRVPLVVVITKLDLASRSGLKTTLSKVLDALKTAGRRPVLLPNAPGAVDGFELQGIRAEYLEAAYRAAVPLLNDPLEVVPIVLTSAVHGTGMGQLHALLHELPVLAVAPEPIDGSGTTFHIEDVYTKPAESEAIILSGRLRSGQLSVGDTAVVGPFSGHDTAEDSEDSDERAPRRHAAPLTTSRSFPGALKTAHFGGPTFQLPNQEWRHIRITSIRNLRLPTHSLLADQIGTIAVVPVDAGQLNLHTSALLARARKGMVLATVQPLAARTFVAEFKREDLEALAVGNHVVIYSASVRASAKIVSARAPDTLDSPEHSGELPDSDHFSFDGMMGTLDISASRHVAGIVTATHLLVTFLLDSAKECLILGDQVLVMPGGGPGLYGGQERGEKGMAGLEGFVGTITEVLG